MTITQHISIDLQQPGNAPMIHAVQGDEYTRKVEIDLYTSGVAWNPPSGCEVVIRYGKPDGKGGVYGNLPDGTTAWSIEVNTISVILAPQMLTVPGIVNAQAQLIVDGKQIVSTFHFSVNVEEDSSKGAVKSENYVNWKTYYIPQTKNAKVGEFLQIAEVDADGRIVKVVPVDNPADGAVAVANDALQIAQNVAQEMEDYSPSGTRSIAEAAMRMASERLVAPPNASVGQYFRVAAVDANGNVTAVEAVDAPAGGGSGVYVGDEDEAVLAEIFINPDDPPTDYIPAPLAATVGQTMVVEKVNGNGVPTKWRVSDLPTVPNALPNPHPLTIGDQTYDGSTAVNIKLPSGDSGGGRLLGEITLSEDVNGTIIIPLNDNPFLYGKLLIEMNAQRVDNGDGQYMGTIFGGTKKSSIFHLNTLFSADKTSTFWVMVDLFRDMVHSIATRKVDYMWLTNNQYSFAYEIDETQNASDNMLEISWCSAVSGATFKVWGE